MTETEVESQVQSRHQRYFDIRRDLSYPRFCKACLSGKDETEMSPKDFRYCLFCQGVIQGEYQRVADAKGKPLSYFYKPEVPLNVVPPTGLGGKNMLPSETAEIPRYHNSTDSPRRGPKQKPLPEERIRGLSSAGLGVKAIAHELKVEGILISAQTISRLLRGKRRQLELVGAANHIEPGGERDGAARQAGHRL